MMLLRRAFIYLISAGSLFMSAAFGESLQPGNLHDAIDINPDPHIVEVNLEASVERVEIAPGKQVESWTYNGGIPGPLIRIHVGDRLIVHFKNNLPQPSTVHWHGLRIPIQMDGVPGHSQPEVKPGETFTYDFIAPDAGLFWYHPHVMSALQVGFGLYGPLLVESSDEPLTGVEERVLVLSDIDVEDNGKLRDPANAGIAGKVFGLEGEHILVNGRKLPKWEAPAAAPQRWRIVNAAKSRYFELSAADALQFTVIGGDGGLQEYPTDSKTLVVAPGERVDAIVRATGAPGDNIIVQSLPFNRGYGSGYYGPEDVFTVTLTQPAAAPRAAALPTRRSIEPIPQSGATPILMDVTLVQVDARNIEYRINGAPGDKFKPIQAKLGETQIWTIKNETQWSHPFHLHGFFFQVLDEKGEPVRPLAWKDTVDVPFEKTVKLIVRYDDRAGSWMFHCHILDHAEGGLMGMVEVGLSGNHDHTHH